MKKYSIAIILLLLAQQSIASNLFSQLCAFNNNWERYENRLQPSAARFFASEKEYIQVHLSNVLFILATNSVTHLNNEQYQSRMQLIALLNNYRLVGKFPLNYYRQERIPVFIDEHNTHCAVGYLLQQTGHGDIAKRIAAADNYAWVKDIHDEGLMAWQPSSGLSIEELKLIQGAYDYYMPNAFFLPNKYEIPQKPACVETYFETTERGHRPLKTKFVWCRGEGSKGILNGRWEQNYSAGIPWIVGYFDNGKRAGQWMEYYQGTNILCRTENWRDDKLNGIRKRFDREGHLTEEILFKDGNAVVKTNYDLGQSLTWVRRQVDSLLVFTEVYTMGGGLVAAGHERIHNPGNLLWFQNIELTALNSISIASRQAITESILNGNGGPNWHFSSSKTVLYNQAPLVEYKKEGDWIYFKDCLMQNPVYSNVSPEKEMPLGGYKYFGNMLCQSIPLLKDVKTRTGYDSIKVIYAKNTAEDFYGFINKGYVHIPVEKAIAQNIKQPANRRRPGMPTFPLSLSVE